MIPIDFPAVGYTEMPYDDYLHTYWWIHAVRLPALDRAQWSCQRCHQEGGLEVHHRYYNDEFGSILGREKPEDLIVLCQGCHQRFHIILAAEKRFFLEAA